MHIGNIYVKVIISYKYQALSEDKGANNLCYEHKIHIDSSRSVQKM